QGGIAGSEMKRHFSCYWKTSKEQRREGKIHKPLIKLLFFDASPYLVFIFPHLYRLLGLCNNFAYVVMLSAAHDILEKQESRNETASVRKQMCI
uniref:PARP-type domain-containing protein n=1 Tax=Astatotilapia calliptera TaxID=8154 RepID=A0AAX7SEW1_ASTCA